MGDEELHNKVEKIVEIERRLDDIHDEIIELQGENKQLKSARKLVWRTQIVLAGVCGKKLVDAYKETKEEIE